MDPRCKLRFAQSQAAYTMGTWGPIGPQGGAGVPGVPMGCHGPHGAPGAPEGGRGALLEPQGPIRMVAGPFLGPRARPGADFGPGSRFWAWSKAWIPASDWDSGSWTGIRVS